MNDAVTTKKSGSNCRRYPVDVAKCSTVSEESTTVSRAVGKKEEIDSDDDRGLLVARNATKFGTLATLNYTSTEKRSSFRAQ